MPIWILGGVRFIVTIGAGGDALISMDEAKAFIEGAANDMDGACVLIDGAAKDIDGIIELIDGAA